MNSSKPTPAQIQLLPRRRGAVACALLVLLWCAWNYCADGDGNALFWTTAVLGLVALALPRPLPNTVRSVVWGSLALIVIALAANVDRLMPVKNDFVRLHVIDRVVTVAFAGIGLSALFFRIHGVAITKILLGTLPMAMLSIARVATTTTSDAFSPAVQIWLQIGLLMLLELVRQGATHRARGLSAFGLREWTLRGVMMSSLLGLAILLRGPVEYTAMEIQRRVLGMSLHTQRHWQTRRQTDLALFRALPSGFSGRTRILLLAEARTAPGYLRESVFTTYAGGRWQTPEAGLSLDPAAARVSGEGWIRYALTPVPAATPLEQMRFTVFSPRHLTGVSIPGNTVSLFCLAEDEPFVTTNGMVQVDGSSAMRYEVEVRPSGAGGTAFPLPDGGADRGYLGVPETLTMAVSNWVANCPGLSTATTPRNAATCIENDFAVRFRYRDDVSMNAHPDPLLDFMKRREGYCVHFASAAALMLRLRGIPTRLVGGYLCHEWAPWLKRWVVRERQGHAWAEAWDADHQNWFLVETTPANGRPDHYHGPGLLRRAQDVVIASWKWLLGAFESVHMLQWLADAGAAVVHWLWQGVATLWGLALFITALAGVIWHRRQRHTPRTPEEQGRADLTTALSHLIRRTVPARFERRPTESWDDWLNRIQPDLAPDTAVLLAEWVETYQQLRYQAELDMPRVRAWIAAATAVNPLSFAAARRA